MIWMNLNIKWKKPETNAKTGKTDSDDRNEKSVYYEGGGWLQVIWG